MVAEAGEHEVRLVEQDSLPPQADVVVSLTGSLRPPDARLPSVTAIYDLSHLLAPRSHTFLERARRGWLTALLTRRADGLVAPSHAIARALVDYLRVSEDRLTWVPTIGPGWRRAPRAEVERVRGELELKERYLLFVGTISRRKNLRTLMRAWDVLWPRLGQGVDLVIAGAAPARGGVLDEVLSGGARYVGPVPDGTLLPLLSGATAWVCPSLAEGCSIGAVEAMAAGAPPLVAAGTALADIVGAAGMVLPAEDVQAWADAMRHLVEDPQDRNRMAARGLRAAADLRESEAGRRVVSAAAAAAAASR
jgi:glycosyltransferase involved in cell wall biosynthesis